ncbi:MAG: sulfotransferase [Acidimicrobiia bacterium]
MNAPILVTGPDRSGTTLLYTILASHPEIMMVRRTNLWRWFDNKYGDLSQPANLDACLETMMRYERLSVLSIDPVMARAEFEKGERSYGRLFEILFQQQAERSGRARWGDKSLHTELCADRVFEEWPHARIVYLMRDPRDRYISVIGREGKGSDRHASVIGRWIRSTRAAEDHAKRRPQSFRIIRYEDLVADPERVVRDVCEFVGVEYHPAMLEMGGGDDRTAQGGNSSFEPIEPGVITTRSVGRYRNVLDEQTVAFIQTVCGPWMRRHGYELDPLNLSPAERIRAYVIDLPIGVARISMWLMAEAVAESRGRTVPEARLCG